MATADDPTAVFERYRSLLGGVAYRVLGRTGDTEDVVQEAWLRWRGVAHAEVAEPRTYLVRIVTRLAIDRLRLAQERRETYVGPWLPEPILAGPDAGAGGGGGGAVDPGAPEVDPETGALRADSVSVAMLVVLETLSPTERAVFVLREAFGFSYAEIARMLDRTEQATRQLGHRARRHVADRRPRFTVDQTLRRQVTERFLTACVTGDLDGLVALLAPDARLAGDGGGVAKAPLRTIVGPDKVARFLQAIATQPPPDPYGYLADVNGVPALVVTSGDLVVTAFVLDVDGSGQVRTIHLLANPDKLTALSDVTRIGTPVPLVP